MSHWQIKNIALISRSNPRYVMHCHEQISLKNSISKERVVDPQQVVTAWAESSINRLLCKYYESDDRSILTWEELGAAGSYRRKYRELDGLFKSANGILCVETKASTSNSSVKKGRSQINENLQILSGINSAFSALLVLCDCHVLDQEFGVMSPEMSAQLLTSNEYSIFQGLTDIPKIIPKTKSMWIIDEISVLEMVKVFGPPVDEFDSPDF